jgi:hypothetical protein
MTAIPSRALLVVRLYCCVAHYRLPSYLRLRDIHAALSTVAGSAWEIHGVDEWDEGGE